MVEILVDSLFFVPIAEVNLSPFFLLYFLLVVIRRCGIRTKRATRPAPSVPPSTGRRQTSRVPNVSYHILKPIKTQ